jgi:hypothetical protein
MQLCKGGTVVLRALKEVVGYRRSSEQMLKQCSRSASRYAVVNRGTTYPRRMDGIQHSIGTDDGLYDTSMKVLLLRPAALDVDSLLRDA